MTRRLILLAITLIALGGCASASTAARSVRERCPGATGYAPRFRFERWEENAPLGGGLEGLHAWMAAEVYLELVERGVRPLTSAVLVVMGGFAVELLEVGFGDAKGVSVQDLVANAAGVLAVAAGADVSFQYAARFQAPTDYNWWARVPLAPANGQSNAVEIQAARLAVGAKYRGAAADVTLGFSTLPVFATDEGNGTLVPYVGYVAPVGLHLAVGYDPEDRTLEVGGGYRVTAGAVGIDFQVLLAGGEPGVGIAVYFSGRER